MRLRGTGILRTATARRAGAALSMMVVVLVTAVPASAHQPTGAPRTGGARQVNFRGYHLTVPASWPVYDLTRNPSTCVRFNRHAVYLGTPSSDQRCPAGAIGRTGAVLLAPLRAGSAAATPGDSPVTPLPSAGSSATFVAGSKGLVATVTWSHDQGLVSGIVHRRLTVARGPERRASATAGAASAGRAPTAHAAEIAYDGLGFDACSAPSSQAMSDWSATSYRAVGIYVGGTNEACSQPNLTPGWVDAEVAAGWHLIPTYVGLQGSGACGGTCSTISPRRASAQGSAAAQDAVSQVQALGIQRGNPIYDDMEQYPGSSRNTAAVLAFLSAWTRELHAAGYLSGVYGSGSSAISNLVHRADTGYSEPDDIWIGDWNGRRTTADPYVPGSDWSEDARIHQYSGAHNETHGGKTLNVDGDYVAGATAGNSTPIPDGTFVQDSPTAPLYRVAGGAPLYVSSWLPFVYPQPVEMISAGQFAGLAPYPDSGTFIQSTDGAIYRIAGGAPIAVSSWSVFGGPEPDVVVDAWDLENIGNPLDDLRATPVDGTVVEGLPSRRYWSFTGGLRIPAKATATATQVDDAGLAAFAQAPPGTEQNLAESGAQCVVPRLRHMTLARARTALKRADCHLGTVKKPSHPRRHHVLRVFGQSVAPRTLELAGRRIDLRLT